MLRLINAEANIILNAKMFQPEPHRSEIVKKEVLRSVHQILNLTNSCQSIGISQLIPKIN